MVLLNDVAFDMPVNPDVSVEIILTHALHNPGEVQEPTVGPTATAPMEPERKEPMAEPATPVSLESPVLEPEAEFAKVLVESYDDHLATTAVAPGVQNEDCRDWLSDKDIEQDNPAPQDPCSLDTMEPPVMSPVTSPITDWVEHTLLNTDWDSISPEEDEADGDPTEPEPTLDTTPKGESTGTPTNA
jgi:hypothetical protein